MQQDRGKKKDSRGGKYVMSTGRPEKRKVGQVGGSKGNWEDTSCKRTRLNDEKGVGPHAVDTGSQKVGNIEGGNRNDKGVSGCPLTATRSQ